MIGILAIKNVGKIHIPMYHTFSMDFGQITSHRICQIPVEILLLHQLWIDERIIAFQIDEISISEQEIPFFDIGDWFCTIDSELTQSYGIFKRPTCLCLSEEGVYEPLKEQRLLVLFGYPVTHLSIEKPYHVSPTIYQFSFPSREKLRYIADEFLH